MMPRIKLTAYKQEGRVNGAWVREIWLVTSEQVRTLGFVSKTAEQHWSAVFIDPSSSAVIKRRCPSLRAARAAVAVALGL